MTVATAPLGAVLARHDTAAPDLEAMNADDLKRAARFWYGTTASNKMRKAECVRALNTVFRDRRRLQEGLRSLPDKQRQILSLFRRYGGALSGSLLQCEALTRGLVEKTEDRRCFYADTIPTTRSWTCVPSSCWCLGAGVATGGTTAITSIPVTGELTPTWYWPRASAT